MDFGEALAFIGGRLEKIHYFAMSLVHSDAMFVMAFPRECTEAFLEAHIRAFEFFGFVPRRISYDNTRIAVKKFLGPHERKFTQPRVWPPPSSSVAAPPSPPAASDSLDRE